MKRRVAIIKDAAKTLFIRGTKAAFAALICVLAASPVYAGNRFDVSVEFCGPVGIEEDFEILTKVENQPNLRDYWHQQPNFDLNVSTFNGNDKLGMFARAGKFLDVGETRTFTCNEAKGGCVFTFIPGFNAGASGVSDGLYYYNLPKSSGFLLQNKSDAGHYRMMYTKIKFGPDGFIPGEGEGEGKKNHYFTDVALSFEKGTCPDSFVVTPVTPNAPVVWGSTPTRDTTPTWTWTGDTTTVNWTGADTVGSGIYRYKLNDSDLSSGATETTETTYTPDSPLSAGTGRYVHTLYVQERAVSGDHWSESGAFEIVVDLREPNPPRVGGTTPNNRAKPTWTWSSGGRWGSGTYRYKFDDSDLSSGATETTATAYTPDSPLSEGTYTLYVQERNDSGWSASGAFAIEIDLTPPNPPLVTGMTPFGSSPTWRWTSGGGGNGTYRYRLRLNDLNSFAIQSTSTEYTPSSLPDGRHTLYVQERDDAGNWSASGSFMLNVGGGFPGLPGTSRDLTAPTTTLTTAPPTSTTATDAVFEFTGDDGDGEGIRMFQCQIDHQLMWSVCTSPHTYTGLSLGERTVTIRAVDWAGNTEFPGVRHTWTITSKPAIALRLADAAATEADGIVTIPVSLSAASAEITTLSYTTGDGSAQAGSDYVATSGTLTIPSGSTSAAIDIPIVDDAFHEASETFLITVSLLSGNVILEDGDGIGTITDDDDLPVLHIGDATANEEMSSMIFTVILSSMSTLDVSVMFNTIDDTALAGADYAPSTGTLTIAAGETSGTVEIALLSDAVFEDDEFFEVMLSNPLNALLGDWQGRGTIQNVGDVGGPGAPGDPSAVPEPGTVLLLGTGLLVVLTWARRKRAKQ